MALYSNQIIKANYYIQDRELNPPECLEGECLECLNPCNGDFCCKQCENAYTN